MGSRGRGQWVFIAGLCVLGVNLTTAALAQTFCDPEEQFFQEKPTPATPRERVNGINLSSCTSGMPCLNQLRAAMTQKQPLPAAHRWVDRDPPQPDCLQSVPSAGSQPDAKEPTANPPAPTP